MQVDLLRLRQGSEKTDAIELTISRTSSCFSFGTHFINYEFTQFAFIRFHPDLFNHIIRSVHSYSVIYMSSNEFSIMTL